MNLQQYIDDCVAIDMDDCVDEKVWFEWMNMHAQTIQKSRSDNILNEI